MGENICIMFVNKRVVVFWFFFKLGPKYTELTVELLILSTVCSLAMSSYVLQLLPSESG